MLTESEKEDLKHGKPSWKTFMLAFIPVLGLLLLIPIQFYKRSQRKAVIENRSVETATITHLRYTYKRGINWYRTFAKYQVDGIDYECEGKAMRRLTQQRQDSLIGLKLPVVFNRNDPKNSALLYREGQFNKFQLPFPDSLGWTRSYFLD